MDLRQVEQQLCQLPFYQYLWLTPEELPFSERVREVCRGECPMYGKSWSCPPAVGTVTECRERCLRYDKALLLVTVQEVADSSDLEQTLATKPAHTALVAQVRQMLVGQGCETLCLSADACSRCESCTCPDMPCRAPEAQTPCLEGYGIVVSDLAERCGVPFPPEPNLVYWYACILFSGKD